MSSGGPPAASPALAGLPGVRATVSVDRDGRLRASGAAPGAGNVRFGAQLVGSVVSLSEAGRVAGFGELAQVIVRGRAAVTVTALGGGEVVQAVLDPAQPTAEVERALAGWAAAPGRGGPALPSAAAGAATPEETLEDTWAALRRALIHERLADAAALRARLGLAGLDAAEEQGLEVLLDGVSSIVAGDALGGARALRPLAAAAQPRNIRWVALFWSARAALRCNAAQAARWYAKEALLSAKELEGEAQAASYLSVGEVVSSDGDLERALSWFRKARTHFEAGEDGWGQGRAWLCEAAALARAGQPAEAVAAARRAAAVDPTWDEPGLFLARAAADAGDLDGAERAVLMLSTPSADRVRALFAAVRHGDVSPADAAEVLRQDAAPPSAAGLAALDRIAHGSTQLPQAREALAWMLLRAGRYADAATLFRDLLGGSLAPAVRASVMRGLGCVAHALQTEEPGAAEPAAEEAAPEGDATPAATLAEAVSAGASAAEHPAARAALGGGVAFSGQLSVFALPDLLEFLRGARRTGVLVCSSAAGVGSLRFHEGWIAGGAAPAVPRLGELLLRAGKVDPAELEKVAADAQRGDRALGASLVSAGAAAAVAVEAALREQIERAVKVLVGWKEGEFAFNHDAHPETDGLDVQVDGQGVLLEVFRQLDEAARDGDAA